MPENKPISAATSFMSQVTNTGNWQPIDMKHAAIYFFIKMLKDPKVEIIFEINV